MHRVYEDGGREIVLTIFRHNPNDEDSIPHFQDYPIIERPGMTLYIALTQIYTSMDHDVSFDFVCRAGICGSCAMVVNGKPRLACRTLTSEFSEGKITLLPLPTFQHIKDLSVDTGTFMNAMTKRVEGWIVNNSPQDISTIEKPIDPELSDEIFELDRCIECGICLASCATKVMRPNFVGAVGLNRVARFSLDPHDSRSDEEFYELIGDDEGIFGCMSFMGCQDHCPKHLPLQKQIAYMRNKMVKVR